MTDSWSIELLGVAASLGFGVVVFFIARAIYPDTFVRAVAQRREELRASSSREESHSGGRLQRKMHGLSLHVTLIKGAALDALEALVAPLMWASWTKRMRRKFMAMGRPEYEPVAFRVRQLLFALVLGVFALTSVSLLGRSWLARVALTSIFGVLGFFFPYLWLRDQIVRRHKSISRALPYHLDLLTLALEAGLDFAQGLATVIEKGRPGALLEELNILVSEMKLGKTREEGLRNMSERIQMAEVATFTSTLIQADKMGTSLGKVLRVQSGQMRVMRVQAAEKAANEAPVKMLLPLVLCFFPTMFIILFGPILYRMMYASVG